MWNSAALIHRDKTRNAQSNAGAFVGAPSVGHKSIQSQMSSASPKWRRPSCVPSSLAIRSGLQAWPLARQGGSDTRDELEGVLQVLVGEGNEQDEPIEVEGEAARDGLVVLRNDVVISVRFAKLTEKHAVG
jgi:hypothetical protein